MYIDIHTHTLSDDAERAALVNINTPSFRPVDGLENNRFSAGIHPWRLLTATPEEIDKSLSELETAAENGFIDAIGECGLDRAAKASFETQMAVFLEQAEMAERHSLPLVIHCVKACPELISAAKTISPTRPWLVHGFSGGVHELEQLLKHDCFVLVSNSL
jgi:TatD DNase family protein